jgi:hypothetical protein
MRQLKLQVPAPRMHASAAGQQDEHNRTTRRLILPFSNRASCTRTRCDTAIPLRHPEATQPARNQRNIRFDQDSACVNGYYLRGSAVCRLHRQLHCAGNGIINTAINTRFLHENLT